MVVLGKTSIRKEITPGILSRSDGGENQIRIHEDGSGVRGKIRIARVGDAHEDCKYL